MCGSPPGTYCPTDTRDEMGRCLAQYISDWKGAGQPVDPQSSIEAVMSLVRAGQNAGVRVSATSGAPASVDEIAARLAATVRGHNPYADAPGGDSAPDPGSSDRVARLGQLMGGAPATPKAAPRPLESFGEVDPEAGPFPAADGAWNEPDPQATQVQVGHRTFHKRAPGTYAGWPDGIRVEVGREINNQEMRNLAAIVKYSGRSDLRNAEGLDGPHRDGPNSFVMYLDATKTYSDDVGIAHERFEENLPDRLREGTPIRKTDKGGPGTKGTRKWDGVADIGEVSIWYDDVVTD